MAFISPRSHIPASGRYIPQHIPTPALLSLPSVCYDRAPHHPMAMTFVLSALWHGVYPGYYFTFITAIPITAAARAVSGRARVEG